MLNMAAQTVATLRYKIVYLSSEEHLVMHFCGTTTSCFGTDSLTSGMLGCMMAVLAYLQFISHLCQIKSDSN